MKNKKAIYLLEDIIQQIEDGVFDNEQVLDNLMRLRQLLMDE